MRTVFFSMWPLVVAFAHVFAHDYAHGASVGGYAETEER